MLYKVDCCQLCSIPNFCFDLGQFCQGHINLGKKGYRVPEAGTIQLTLFNPLGTVVKMFVVMYDLRDMPPNSQTFLRQVHRHDISNRNQGKGTFIICVWLLIFTYQARTRIIGYLWTVKKTNITIHEVYIQS